MENTKLKSETIENKHLSNSSTIALSLILHGEAVRFNRGNKSGPNIYDFKHMIGPKGEIVPYISSQSFKKNWRETLPYLASEITRVKNHAYTSGDPMIYVDDDLFGYMIAGASSTPEKSEVDTESDSITSPEDQDEQIANIVFRAESFKSDKSWLKALKKIEDKVAIYLIELLSAESRKEFDDLEENDRLPDSLREPIAQALNSSLEKNEIFDSEHFGKISKKSSTPKLTPDELKSLKSDDPIELRQAKYGLLEKRFKACFETPKNRIPTKRTAPIRMHAPIAFCGVRLAKDFQTLSRHVASTGETSVLNPNAVGIYSGWLKTRILIEAFRVGKFYVGENMDILDEQIGQFLIQNELNPYDRQNKQVRFIQLSEEKRCERIAAALESLGNIGNAHGRASGALHDGSLKPRAFIGALMNCADSPFDAVWEDNGGTPRLNFSRLKAVLRDWEDLFETKTIYVGIAPEMLGEDDVETFASIVSETLKPIGFESVVDTPRRALKTMANSFAG